MSSFVFRITGRRTASIDTPNIEHLSPLSFFRVTRCIINLHDALAASDFALTHSSSLHPTPAFPLFSRAASVKSCGENVQGGTVVYPWKCGSNGQGGGGPPPVTGTGGGGPPPVKGKGGGGPPPVKGGSTKGVLL